jgi:hypothetical protein
MNQKQTIVHIGAFEGNDELTKIVKKIGAENIENLFLIEPNIKCNKKLVDCYKGFNFSISNIVITDDDTKKMESFFISDGHESISSILESHPLGHRGVETTTEYVLKCSTINNFLEKNKINNLDILYINASGFDEKIIKSIDFNKFNISEIYYENCKITDNDKLVNFLQSKGFKIQRELFDFGWVNLATKNNITTNTNNDNSIQDINNNEILLIKYQKPHGSKWSVHNIIDKFYEKFKENQNYKNVETLKNS